MEDSQAQIKTLESEREALIVEMVRDAQTTELPSELTKNPVLNPEDKEAPPTIVSQVSSAGYVWVWDSRTYERIPILYYMLATKLRQRRQDGSYQFTTIDPKKLPRRGTHKCLLHKDSPNRAHYDELGFVVCKKDNINNLYQVRQHMKLKHQAEWASIEEERKEKQRQEDRELQRLIIGKVVEKPEVKTQNDIFTCEVCGKNFAAKIALEGHKRSHKIK